MGYESEVVKEIHVLEPKPDAVFLNAPAGHLVNNAIP
jgi:hypothetical protein